MELDIVIGAILAGGIGILTVYITKYIEEKKTKLSASKALLAEVEANQERLQRLVNVKNALKDKVGDVQLSTEIYFDEVIYPALAGKIGLLDDVCCENLVNYYGKINSIVFQLRVIHGISTQPPQGLSNQQIPLLNQGATKTFFEFAEEAYTIGEELINNLKEQIG